MVKLNRRGWLGLGAASAFAIGTRTSAAPAAANFARAFDPVEIGRIVERFRAAFEIPGLAIAAVAPGQRPFVQGYGVRRLGAPAAVDADTQFAIASNTKAFTGVCLAQMVEAGRIAWEDPVIRHLPEFQMNDPAVTRMMTVRDLLVHRSGLPLGAGDLMQFPPSTHTAEDLLRALRYFPQSRGFREGYAYDNSLYVVAGLLLERVSGLSWSAYLQERIFAPLGMKRAVAHPSLARSPNLAGRHARLGPPTRGFGPVEPTVPRESAMLGPAGGIVVSAAEIVPWLQVQLAKGKLPAGGHLLSEAQVRETWTPQTIVSSGPGPFAAGPHEAVLQGYALGWGVIDYRGRRKLTHGGGLSGQVTRTAILPDDGVALAIYSNSEEQAAVSALRYALLDHMLGDASFDWLAAALAQQEQRRAEVLKVLQGGEFRAPPGGPSLPLDGYAGRYRDRWYGDIVGSRRADRLHIDFTPTPSFKSQLEPFGPDAFRTRFPRGAGEDAVVMFDVRDGAVQGVKMKALSPIADFSFDFHDLEFVPVRG